MKSLLCLILLLAVMTACFPQGTATATATAAQPPPDWSPPRVAITTE